MKFDQIEPGTKVYAVGKTKMGNTTLTTVSVWPVFVEAVDAERKIVTARWNGNPARKFSQSSYAKWRKTPPELVTNGLGMKRLATKAEIAAKTKGQP